MVEKILKFPHCNIYPSLCSVCLHTLLVLFTFLYTVFKRTTKILAPPYNITIYQTTVFCTQSSYPDCKQTADKTANIHITFLPLVLREINFDKLWGLKMWHFDNFSLSVAANFLNFHSVTCKWSIYFSFSNSEAWTAINFSSWILKSLVVCHLTPSTVSSGSYESI